MGQAYVQKQPKLWESLPPKVAARISINTGPNAFYGEKYKIEKVFEDDGKIMSGITSAVYDSRRKKLFMNGMSSL